MDVFKVDHSRIAAVRGGWRAVCCGRAVGPARAGRDADWDGTDAIISSLLDFVSERPVVDWQRRCRVGAAGVIARCQCTRVEANGRREDGRAFRSTAGVGCDDEFANLFDIAELRAIGVYCAYVDALWAGGSC